MISVIIPVYNVEKYLRRCVDSVLNQSYRDLEIILVDDGSLDKSSHICDEYALLDCRVKVIHKKNGGQSSARNAALNYTLSGDFISFVDSDDWIEPDAFEYCIKLVNEYNAECVQYEVNFSDGTNKTVANPKEFIKVYEGKDVLQYFMYRATIAPGGYSVWGGIYNRKLLDGLRFREGKINEDIDFKFKMLQRCQMMIVSNQKKYDYFQDSQSTTRGGLRSRDFQLREAADLLCDLASKEEYGTIAELGRVKKARTAFSLLCKIAFYGVADESIDKKQTVCSLTAEHRRNLPILLKAPIPMSRKVLAVLLAVNFNLTEKILKFKK